MNKISVGDMVTRRSYGEDIVFYVRDIVGTEKPIAQLIGVNVRLYADSFLDDLIVLYYRVKPSSPSTFKTLVSQIMLHHSKPVISSNNRLEATPTDFLPLPGKVLHIDGEEHYLKQCMGLYKSLNVPARGIHIPERDQPHQVKAALEEHNPDILVITGHDGLLRKQSDRDYLIHYRSSQYFVEAVKRARSYEPDRDALVIIAGACQSHFEALIRAGANFASAPERVMIHCYDPVFIAEKLAYTPFTKVVDVRGLLTATISGKDGIGGIETKGKLRQAFPRIKNWIPANTF